MGFLTVNHSLNQTFFVEKTAFEKLVKKAAGNSKLTKAKSIEVELNSSKNVYKVDLVVEIKKGATYKEALLEITNEIEKYSKNITGSKPENISIVVDGEF